MNLISKPTLRTIIYTLVIGGSFYSGVTLYSLSGGFVSKNIATASLKEFRPILESYKYDIVIHAQNKKITVNSKEAKGWFEAYTRNYSGKTDLRLSQEKIMSYLDSLATQINSEPVDAKLQFKNSRAEVFVPSRQGYKINIPLSASIIQTAILDSKPSISLEFDVIEPQITLERINDLGIKTLLGRGESDYGKSSTARIHNIKIGLSKFNGIILKPGEEFSFNSFLGEVDETEGYQAELVIKGGQLVREYGGGLCQVATTVFRGAIMSGMDIKERKPHSFPVQYYDPQGFDATIYPGVVDLRFINNTPNHLLIQARLAGSRLVVEMYGSSSDREVSIDGPYQYAKKPDGSMKAYFTRKITENGQTLEERQFDSTYKPPPPHPLERNPLE